MFKILFTPTVYKTIINDIKKQIKPITNSKIHEQIQYLPYGTSILYNKNDIRVETIKFLNCLTNRKKIAGYIDVQKPLSYNLYLEKKYNFDYEDTIGSNTMDKLYDLLDKKPIVFLYANIEDMIFDEKNNLLIPEKVNCFGGIFDSRTHWKYYITHILGWAEYSYCKKNCIFLATTKNDSVAQNIAEYNNGQKYRRFDIL